MDPSAFSWLVWSHWTFSRRVCTERGSSTSSTSSSLVSKGGVGFDSGAGSVRDWVRKGFYMYRNIRIRVVVCTNMTSMAVLLI